MVSGQGEGSVKILALSDVHCDWDRFPIEEMPEADCAVVAGDLTDWGIRGIQEDCNAQGFLEYLVAQYVTVFWIPGNHEVGIGPTYYDEDKGIVGIYHKRDCCCGLIFQGVSCSPCYDMPSLANTWDYMTADPAKEKAVYESLLPCDVLVSHCPPYGYLDNWGHGSIGSKELLAYIERHKPKLVICGHVHEDGGKECMIGSTRVVNTARHWTVLEV
jgi:Icc-related predicted phosphoesterase